MLRLLEPGRSVWERFLSGGENALLEDSSDGLLRHWSRAVALGAKAEGPLHAEGVTDADLTIRREVLRERCVDAVQLVSRLASETSASAFRAVLTDSEGVVVFARGGQGISRRSTDTSCLVEGARWSESTRGTNAIGTSIQERQPVAVVGRAHFEERNHGLVCYAAPVRDPFGDIAAVLDVSGDVSQQNPLWEALVLATAHAAEQSLRLRAYEDMLVGGRARLEAQLAGSAALLLEAPGIVGQVTADGAKLLGAPPSQLMGKRVEDVLPCSWMALVDAGLAGQALRAPGGRKLRAVPHLDARGRPLALVVFIERDAPKLRPLETLPAAFSRMLGSDKRLREAKEKAARVAQSPLPVLLLAETGTGKELLARAIHDSSERADKPFLALNCGALSQSLLESELFGYAPGAFTGALAGGSKGKIGAVEGGTLFLDEIAEMPESLQAMLLRVLDEGQYFRLGESQPRQANFRLISATCRDLSTMVESGKFRRDLYYRIRGATVTLPPLRVRTDRVELARLLLTKLANEQQRPEPKLSPEAERLIDEHAWPGNVRELKSALGHALALGMGTELLGAEYLPDDVGAKFFTPTAPASSMTVNGVLASGGGAAEGGRRTAEKRALVEAMDAAKGNLSDAARILGVARSTLYRMLRRHGLGDNREH